MPRLLYSLLMLLALPAIVARLVWRSRRDPRYRQHIGERFGLYRQPTLKGSLWLHAVSVGEMRAAQPLVAALRQRWPSSPLLLSCMTPTGRETALNLYGEFATIVYVPYDLGFLLRRLIARFSPRCMVVMETEIWPNMVAACHSAGIPAFLVNARLSEKSLRQYQRLALVRQLIGRSLGLFTGVAAQHQRDADRLTSLGARAPQITGNLKFDVALDESLMLQGRAWRTGLEPPRTVMLAVSTRDGEERAIATAYAEGFNRETRRRQLLVIVPRHPPRFDEAARLVNEAGLTHQRRSSGEPVRRDTEVWLGDSLGEVASYIAMCDFAFVGGSLVPVGGQNLIEVCAQGKPVLMGPSTYNFADAARAAREAGALIAVTDAQDLMRAAQSLFDDADRRASHAQAAAEFSKAHRGATEKTLEILAPVLPRLQNN